MELPTTYLTRHWSLDRIVPGSVRRRHSTRITFSVRSDQGRFIVKDYDEASALGLVRPAPAQIDRQLSVLEYLADKGFGHAPGLLRTRSGERFLRLGGRVISVQEEIVGGPPPDAAATWAEFGRLAACLNAYADYPHAYAVPIEGTIAELARAARRYPFAREFRELVATFEALISQPVGLIHAEINPANAVMSTEGRLFLIDWDQAGTGPRVLEAGYPLLTTFLTEDLVFRQDLAVAFYGAYAQEHAQSAEWPALVFTAALLHALRYLPFGDPFKRWTRIRFALNHRDMLLSAMTTPIEPSVSSSQ